MNIALIGITGNVGSRVAAELLQRNHIVTGIARDPQRAQPRTGVTLVQGDATDAAALAPLLAGHDAVISAGRFLSSDVNALLSAVKTAGIPRLLVVGGAGSLEVAPGMALIDTPQFPQAYKAEAGAGAAFLAALREETALNWTFLSPSAEFVPGERTGVFRLGNDDLLVDVNGRSWISIDDYAIALVDELERPRHARSRFTVGY